MVAIAKYSIVRACPWCLHYIADDPDDKGGLVCPECDGLFIVDQEMEEVLGKQIAEVTTRIMQVIE